MARIRHIKPEFFTHEKLNDLEEQNPGLRVMITFAGLWCIADGNGVFRVAYRTIENQILPWVKYDRKKTLDLLAEHKFIEFIDGEPPLCRIVNFRKHQWINSSEKVKYKMTVSEPPEREETAAGQQATILPPEGNTEILVDQLTGDIFIEQVCKNNGFEIEDFKAFAEKWARNKAACKDMRYTAGRLRSFMLEDYKKELEKKKKPSNGRQIKQRGQSYVAP